MNGKEVASYYRQKIKAETEEYAAMYGRRPVLAVVLVGNDPASISYVTSKRQACEEMGFGHKDYTLEADTSEAELLSLVDQLNRDEDVDGILVQFPTPDQIDDEKVILAISPEKDVDGLHPVNAGLTLMGRDGFASCTPKGILALLDYYHIPVDGKRVADAERKGCDCDSLQYPYQGSCFHHKGKRYHHCCSRTCQYCNCRHGL